MTNHPNRSKKITVIRGAGNVLSVYRGEVWLGMIYCPVPSGGPNFPGHDDYEAVPSARDLARFADEDAAVAYLANL